MTKQCTYEIRALNISYYSDNKKEADALADRLVAQNKYNVSVNKHTIEYGEIRNPKNSLYEKDFW